MSRRRSPVHFGERRALTPVPGLSRSVFLLAFSVAALSPLEGAAQEATAFRGPSLFDLEVSGGSQGVLGGRVELEEGGGSTGGDRRWFEMPWVDGKVGKLAAFGVRTLEEVWSMEERAAFLTQEIEYFVDGIREVDGRRITLDGGSQWLFGLAPDPSAEGGEVLGVFDRRSPRFATLFVQGDPHFAGLLSGAPATRSGTRTRVVALRPETPALVTSEGTRWIPVEGRLGESAFRHPPYPVLVGATGTYLYHLERGRRVDVER